MLAPSPDLLIQDLVLNGSGVFELNVNWPDGLPAGFEIYLQAWIPDLTAPAGFAASNGMQATTP